MLKYDEVIIYSWPWSQNCIGCEHGEFVESETYDSSNYICKVSCTVNTGAYCPMKTETEAIEELEDKDNKEADNNE